MSVCAFTCMEPPDHEESSVEDKDWEWIESRLQAFVPGSVQYCKKMIGRCWERIIQRHVEQRTGGTRADMKRECVAGLHRLFAKTGIQLPGTGKSSSAMMTFRRLVCLHAFTPNATGGLGRLQAVLEHTIQATVLSKTTPALSAAEHRVAVMRLIFGSKMVTELHGLLRERPERAESKNKRETGDDGSSSVDADGDVSMD